MDESPYEREQEQAAAAEAGAIGGRAGEEPYEQDGDPATPAQAPLLEAGQGEAEGFEQSEAELADHASHGDQHAARRVLEDAPAAENERGAPAAAGDEERTSERPGD